LGGLNLFAQNGHGSPILLPASRVNICLPHIPGPRSYGVGLFAVSEPMLDIRRKAALPASFLDEGEAALSLVSTKGPFTPE